MNFFDKFNLNRIYIFLFIGIYFVLISNDVYSNNILDKNIIINNFLLELRKDSEKNGISVDDFDKFTSKVDFVEITINASKDQFKKQDNFKDYILRMINTNRIANGYKILTKYNNDIRNICNTYHVDPEILIAIFGIETNYGTILGNTNILNAWFTRAYYENNPLWKKNFYASIKILRDGIVKPDEFLGSWGGAFGMTQFIPTSFYELSVDWDNDGIADLYNSIQDSLASTANHLYKRNIKWIKNQPPVIEIRLPKNFLDNLKICKDDFHISENKYTLEKWSKIGATSIKGESLYKLYNSYMNEEAFLLLPSGINGPQFLALSNYQALLKYNNSHKYALVVSILNNIFKGENILQSNWFKLYNN
ncbi:Membrane-bound lytic murein transglycosylase B [Candidatus Kinetoplastibacterium sorsogonicusi]|uniref:Membrane-bound lytic murein transglycosylase B n=1 Tax=Candidatus Kinetoplastidibacterium kentomonadis TaxID=1576550 RepID=A0A3S7J9G1_9PROT|nr:lytic murein transglycosylase [Candidatus Kinetoplastibacterium sorsogonicusi]AWD32313.1 Membrane-bound lytic murein transglycosylase B [Candidatus Kinetoplastibacterium sorsogonicusi]